MLSLVLIGSLIALVLGLAAKVVLDKTESEFRITWPEFGICAAVIILVVAPLVSWVGEKAAFSNQITYHENWGGYELQANWIKTTCSEDGPCYWTYDCDPYQVYVVDSPAYTDDKGNYHAETGHYETRYHSCPYVTEEWTFTVSTTLGEYTIAPHNVPYNPERHRWEPERGERLQSGLPVGIPDFWQQAKNRLDAGNPGPVTARRDYENYILASQSSILHKFSGAIDQYKKDGILPNVNSSVYAFYYEDRVYFVGAHPAGNWQWYINKFNAALGVALQGDLHLVIVDANKVGNADEYSQALVAYWQSKDFDRDALSKNGIVVVIGTKDGTTVDWARAATGMPVGNEAMLVDIQNTLTGKPLTPEAILGEPTATLTSYANNHAQFAINHSTGALDSIVLQGPHAFQRVCMKCVGEGRKGVGYTYLKNEIQPTDSQRHWIEFFVVLFSCAVWGVAIAVGVPAHRQYWR